MTIKLLRKLLFICTLLFSLSGLTQTATVTIYYSGAQAWGCCSVCGTDYMCIGSSGCGCCQPSQQTKTFMDPVPAGNIVTAVEVRYYAADCSATNVPSSLNGVLICAAVNPGSHTCACGSCNQAFCSTSYPCGLPSYNYGGINTLYSNPWPNGTEICTQRVRITLTYAPGGPSAPATPGPITGPLSVCSGQSYTYSISPVAGATSYNWTVPAGAVITSGAGTTSITVTFGANGGQVCVTAQNSCGVSAASCITVVLAAAPPTPGPITGTAVVCAGQTFTYTISAVPGATSYNWTVPSGATINSGQGTTSISVTFGASAGQICVTATNACGTSAASCLTISLGLPPATPGPITGTDTVCPGQTFTYSIPAVPGAISYTWSAPSGSVITSGQGTTSVNITFGFIGGQVCVTATNGCGTSPPGCFTIVIGGAPVAPTAITGPVNVCAGSVQTYSITAVPGAASYTWTVPSGTTINSGQGSTSINVTIGLTAGQICVTAVGPCGISPPTCITIVISTIPVTPGAITGPTSVCDGSSQTYTIAAVPGANSYTWSVPSGTTLSSGQGSTSINVTFGASSGDICVTATNGCGTSPSSCVSITVNPIPTVTNVPLSQSVCSGQPTTAVTLTSGVPGASFAWTATATGGLTGYSTSGTNTIPSMVINNPGVTAGTVTITITPSANGCTGIPVDYVITVDPLPSINITLSGPYCIDDPSATLTALPSGGTWSGTGITNPVNGIFDPATATAGVHTITYNYTDPITGCSNSGTQNFTVNALPAVSFTALANVCLGSPPFTLSGGSPAGGVYSGLGVSGSSFNPALAGVGTIVITYTYTSPTTGCTNIATQSITVINGIVVTVTPTDTWVCSGAAASLGASGGTTYTWSPPTGLSSTIGTTVIASPTATTVYTVTGTNSAGCSGTASVTVNVYPQNGLVFAAMPIVGCKPLEVNFVFTPGTLFQDSSWYWDFGDVFSGLNNSYDVAPAHTFDNEGQYTVTLAAITTDGCIETGTYQINVYNKPSAGFEAIPPVADMSNPTITFADQSTGANFWYWNFDDGGSGNSNISLEQFPEHTFSDTGTYNVIMAVESEHGCSDTVSKPVVILPEVLVYLPTAFTPDGDGLNDVFVPSVDGVQPLNFEMFIFDRWGQMVFETKDLRKGWDGAVNGRIGSAPAGSYTWIAYYTSAQNKRFRILGRVMLIK